ncbi:unnamed protein product [Moneuplotes crassus]|uniref:non-specific serine/threonine protein kinase n=1 Tax=Euplotes crassus TaxID=5936 RepID=A0AAD1Y879_EUPCR|nr:unnamed protein product [Moneuplotes crassus]
MADTRCISVRIQKKIKEFLKSRLSNNLRTIELNKEGEEKEFQKNFEIIQELGKGSFGIVYKVKSKSPDGKFYALKKIKCSSNTESFLNEAINHRKVSHPNIIKCYSSFIDNSNNMNLLLEYAAGKDLLQLIQERKRTKRFLPEKIIWEYAWQLCCAVLHIHAKDIIHRDIKATNILLSQAEDNPEKFVIKLADLGESSKLSTEKYLKGKKVGTPLFLAPEVIKHDNYDHRVDVWAIGCVLYHLAALCPPFACSNYETLMNAIRYKNPKPLGLFSKKLSNFIRKMLEKQKVKRPFIIDLFSMFPKGFSLTREIDIENYDKLKLKESNLISKNDRDSCKHKINLEFSAMISRQLKSKEHLNKVLFLENRKIRPRNVLKPQKTLKVIPNKTVNSSQLISGKTVPYNEQKVFTKKLTSPDFHTPKMVSKREEYRKGAPNNNELHHIKYNPRSESPSRIYNLKNLDANNRDCIPDYYQSKKSEGFPEVMKGPSVSTRKKRLELKRTWEDKECREAVLPDMQPCPYFQPIVTERRTLRFAHSGTNLVFNKSISCRREKEKLKSSKNTHLALEVQSKEQKSGQSTFQGFKTTSQFPPSLPLHQPPRSFLTTTTIPLSPFYQTPKDPHSPS